MNGTLSFYECRFSGGDTMKWYGHSIWKRICLNFLRSQVAGTQKLPMRPLASKSHHCGTFITFTLLSGTLNNFVVNSFNVSQESPTDEFFSPDMSGWDMSDASTALDRLHMSDQQRKQLEIATNLEMIHQRVRQVGEFLKQFYLEFNCKFKPEFSCENG